jgi:alkylation response protein AidB-like acyl-CoA dehydrogenase
VFDLELGDELDLLAETARSFAKDHLAGDVREAERERRVGAHARRAFDQIGLAQLEHAEAQGGAGLGPLARALVNEELAAVDVGAALALDRLGPAAYALMECGGPEALEQFGRPLLDAPEGRAVLIAAECGLTIADARISGDVPWVPADAPSLVVVLTPEGAHVVSEGIAATPLRGAGLRAAGASALRLDASPIVASLSSREGARRALGRARLYAASLLLGVLRHAAEFSRGYAQERSAFGRPIAHHQALAFLLTEMHMAVEGTRLLVHEAAWRAEAGEGFEPEAASAFVEAIEAARWVGPAGVQVLGGHGFMQDYPMEKAMREARALGLWFGGIDGAREVAGRALCAQPPPVQLSAGGIL